ncbi:anti-sigma factor [Gemmata sp. G18]|uniref:Anti-sigma factor n=1 Tax=Gemmata palustris TaxID=2822762 RepID=A0ABS5C2M8_9BACT|nr:anti-sigma factor [Gemmata palustris]MBP3959735.1 anti-sigma factor [Gemmata palustris]
MNTDPRPDRLDELLALEATQGLNPGEVTELDALLAALPNEDPDSLERAAAAIHLALSGPPEPLPAHLAERLELAAAAFIPAAPAPARPSRSRPAWAIWAGWAVAACLAGVLVYTQWPEDLAGKRDRLVKDAVAKAEKFAGEKAGATGEVVWSAAKQEGYLEVRGLPPLDPTREQYQLWIVDGGRAKKEPVDGGVFDVQPDGTILVRVRNPIPVKDAKAFAVTKETVGGVVVSDGPMLLVLTPKQG